MRKIFALNFFIIEMISQNVNSRTLRKKYLTFFEIDDIILMIIIINNNSKGKKYVAKKMENDKSKKSHT